MDLCVLTALALTLLQPSRAVERQTQAVSRAVCEAVSTDAKNPVMGSRERDAVLLMYLANAESEFGAQALGDGGESRGMWQLHFAISGGIKQQVKAALFHLHEDALYCPISPLASYMSGSCCPDLSVVSKRMFEFNELCGKLGV